jgi:hypothetical protein
MGSLMLGVDESGNNSLWGHASNALLNESVFINLRARVSGVDKLGPFWYTHGVLIRVGVTKMGELEYYPSNVSDHQWKLLEPLLPVAKKQPGGPGRPPCDLRAVLNGILYVMPGRKPGFPAKSAPPVQ